MFSKHQKTRMSIDEAKSFFLKYDGDPFFMYREEPEKAAEFASARLPRRVLNTWYKEILDNYFDGIITGKKKEDAFVYAVRYISVLRSLKSDLNEYIKKLFVILEYVANELDPKQKIIIMESMAGRTAGRQDGGIYFIKRHTVFRRKTRADLYRALRKLVDFDPVFASPESDRADCKNRYETALGQMKLKLDRDVQSQSDQQNQYIIRSLRESEVDLLKDFLYEAIFVPAGMEPPARDIIDKPELRVYVDDFGLRKGDNCLVADVGGKVIGAVWTRIMNDYGHVDDETPSFAISLYKEYRGLGIGSRLMIKMLELLKAQGYKRASLAVQKSNYAVKMYETVGFITVDESAEEFIMVCEL